MKIVIIGASGFVGSYLVKHLSLQHNVIPIYKGDIDVFDNESVKYFLEKTEPDFVINCLSFGIQDINNRSSDDVAKNLSLFYSFYSNRNLFKYYINIGSGIELTSNDGAYAFSKRLISNQIFNNSKFFNLILYGCFGKHEKETRLLKRFINSKDAFSIKDDRLFDYISIQDFTKIVERVISSPESILHSHINCVYRDKLKISEFLSMFCDINKLEKNFIVESESDKHYKGNYNLDELYGLNLYGIGHGMREYML
jgi:nucleoside-diphosphate-sugar epimerase